MGERLKNYQPYRWRVKKRRSPGLDPLDQFQKSVHERHVLCDQLEAIADDLPHVIDLRQIRSAIQFLTIKLPVYHSDERECLFPLLQHRALQEQDIAPLLSQMQMFQVDDEGYAFEVIDLLSAMSSGSAPGVPEGNGYLLRGFFQNYRRYLSWQSLIILPLANKVLDSEDLATLYHDVQKSRRMATTPLIYLEPTASV